VVVPLEEVVRGNLHALYPDAQVEHVSVFRVTRSGDLGVADDAAGSLLEAVAEAARRRARNAVVRVEIERGMPAPLRHAVLESLRRERAPDDPVFGERDLQEVDGLLDLGAVDRLPVPDGDGAGDPPPPPDYPPFRGARPVPADRPMLDVVGERDVLAHHPFDSFSATVVRFLREAADDAEVAAIRITLSRVGDPSPVVAALLDAARRGASVVAFVELQARFDETSNVRWARALEAAGGRVVYGLPGYKTHAKMALVVRREGGRLRSYAHVGTGNYNARSGRHYTDFSLFSADEALVGDVAELFNALTGSSRPPQRLTHGALVAPHQLLPALVERIAREGAHARAGREARITLKVNGLSDAEVIDALYRASSDGVTVQLIVRGICTLRPGVPGLSSRIRVLSVVGRFLEHSRVYRFANGGDPEYLVGSADLRPRNLRRRVELLVPVRDPAGRATLDRTLDLYLRDPTAWELSAAGSYERRGARGASAQEVLVREARRAREEVLPPRIPPVGVPPMYSPAE
jgi:polyphosphate kinase